MPVGSANGNGSPVRQRRNGKASAATGEKASPGKAVSVGVDTMDLSGDPSTMPIVPITSKVKLTNRKKNLPR